MSEEAVWTLPEEQIQPLFTARRLWTTEPDIGLAMSALRCARPDLRRRAERSERDKQVVSYAALRAGDRLLALRRGTRGSPDLRRRRALLFGGHVDASEPCTTKGLTRALLRELDEEFGALPLAGTPTLLGVVADPFTPVGRRHIAFVFEVWLVESDVWLDRHRDNADYTGQGRRHSMTPLATLLTQRRDDFDPWSQALLDWLEAGVTPGRARPM